MQNIIPYQDLYIYEISGEILDSKTFFREEFIGCWNEREVSCLFFSTPHDEEVQAFIQKRGFRLLSKNVMDYEAWQAGEELKPFKIENLVVSPPWEGLSCQRGRNPDPFDPCVVPRAIIQRPGHVSGPLGFIRKKSRRSL
jgi:hypothetical protein